MSYPPPPHPDAGWPPLRGGPQMCDKMKGLSHPRASSAAAPQSHPGTGLVGVGVSAVSSTAVLQKHQTLLKHCCCPTGICQTCLVPRLPCHVVSDPAGPNRPPVMPVSMCGGRSSPSHSGPQPLAGLAEVRELRALASAVPGSPSPALCTVGTCPRLGSHRCLFPSGHPR